MARAALAALLALTAVAACAAAGGGTAPLHGARRLAVLGTLVPLPDAARAAACVEVRAALSSIASPADAAQHAAAAPAAAFRVCGPPREPRDVALLLPLPLAPPDGGARPGAAQPLLLTVQALQAAGGQQHAWAGSALVPAGAASARVVVNLTQHGRPVDPPLEPPPGRATGAAADAPPRAARQGTAAAAAAWAALQGLAAAPPQAMQARAAEAGAELHAAPVQAAATAGQARPAAAGAGATCGALHRLLPACAAASPASAAHAVSALLAAAPAHAAWLAGVLRPEGAAGVRGECPAWPADVREGAALFLQTCLPRTGNGGGPGAGTTRAGGAAASDQRRAAPSSGGQRPAASYDGAARQLVLRASPLQVLAGAAALLALGAAAALAGGRRRAPARGGAAGAADTRTAGAAREPGHPGGGRASSGGRGSAGGFTLHGRAALASAAGDDDSDADDLAGGTASGGGAHQDQGDPWGYALASQHRGSPGARVPARAPDSSAAASALAAGHAAGTLKAAFAGRAAAAAAAAASAQRAARGPGDRGAVEPPAQPAAVVVVGGGGGGGVSGDDAALRAKVVAGYWDEEDEAAVNALPASIQDHLQAAGRWTRDTGGRLVRGSLVALRAASGLAAAAIARAASGGTTSGGGSAGATGGGGGGGGAAGSLAGGAAPGARSGGTMARSRQTSGAGRPVALLLLALAVAALVQPSAGQGLDISFEQLAIGEVGAAGAFGSFEDLVGMTSTSTGRGTIGKGGSGSSFGSADEMTQLQMSMYYIAGSPKTFLTAPLPRARDQGECSTCVAQAIASAMQIATARATRKVPELAGVSRWDVSPQSLFYCSKARARLGRDMRAPARGRAAGGRTCKTGWKIQEALNFIVDEAPHLIRPTECADMAGWLNDVTKEPQVTQWETSCRQAANYAAPGGSVQCAKFTDAQPWLKCSYRSLSSFWQIQQHIRNHGSVISRITVNDDFAVQFNASARSRRGVELPPYVFNATAKPLFGHAVAIVGYDNVDFTWTILNSWGDTASTMDSERGVTADGLFKIKMGVAGVGVPDQTFGVECVPAPGGPFDLHETQPWRDPKPVTLVDPAADLFKLDPDCYTYTARAREPLSAVADAFGINMRDFVLRNQDTLSRAHGGRGLERVVKYKFPGRRSPSELLDILSVVGATTRDVLPLRAAGDAAAWPFFECVDYDAAGRATATNCTTAALRGQRDGGAGAVACVRPGTVACTLNFYDAEPPATLPRGGSPGEFDRVAYFAAPKYSQARALAGIMHAVEPAITSIKLAPGATMPPSGKPNRLTADSFLVTKRGDNAAWQRPWLGKFTATFGKTGMVLSLAIAVDGGVAGRALGAASAPTLGPRFTFPLIQLRKLEVLDVLFNDGAVPPQLGALRDLNALLITHHCLSGSLPRHLVAGLTAAKPPITNLTTQLSELVIRGHDGDTENAACGIRGPIPPEWVGPAASIGSLDLSRNALTGTVPAELFSMPWRDRTFLSDYQGWGWVDLSFNRLSGVLPPIGAPCPRLAPYALNLAYNHLVGDVPVTWSCLTARAGGLVDLKLDGNAGLTGCAPFSAASSLGFSGTQITGLCRNDRLDTEARQLDALRSVLPDVIAKGPNEHAAAFRAGWGAWLDALGPLSGVLPADQVSATRRYREGEEVRVTLTITLIGSTAYVTSIRGERGALSMARMTELAAALPRLDYFECNWCELYPPKWSNRSEQLLPPDLPAASPYMRSFQIIDSWLTGPVPGSYGSWANLEVLGLGKNDLSGTLPPGLKDAAKLRMLWLGENPRISGTMPSEWGDAQVMPRYANIWVDSTNVTGAIPASWAWFSSGCVNLLGTAGISGCRPSGLVAFTPNLLPDCARNSSEVAALQGLAVLLGTRVTNVDVLGNWTGDPAIGAGPGTAPRYCRLWKGVSCDASNHVSGLDLAGLGLTLRPGAALSLSELIDALGDLPYLRSLNVSRLGVSGPLPADLPMRQGALEVLDLSRNPALTGPIPDMWAGLTALQVLDVSQCTGLTGGLPGWASLQQLRVLRAAGCTGLSGELPPSLGLLKSLTELVVSGAPISGGLPAEWADAAAMRRVADAALAEARAAAAAARAAAATPGAAPRAHAVVAARAARAAEAALRGGGGSGASAGAAVAAAASPSVLGLERLEVLVLSRLKLSGPLPAGFAALTQLRVLDLSRNGGLAGSIPLAFADLEQLQELRLGGNALTGPLPEALARLTSLTALDVSGNAFTGTLPGAYASMRELVALDVSGNAFIGTVPQVWQVMAGPTFKLRCLELFGNPGLTGLAEAKAAIEALPGGRPSASLSPGAAAQPAVAALLAADAMAAALAAADAVYWALSRLSYPVVGTCLVSVPATHAVGVALRCPRHSEGWRPLLVFPFTGGNRHVVLQLMSWLLWTFSLLTFLPVLLALLPGRYALAKDLPTVPNTHVDVISGAAAAVSFVAWLFSIKAILVYDDSKAAPAHGGRAATPPRIKPRPVLASAVVVGLGLLLSLTGCLLLLALEYLPDIPSRVLYCCLSLCCLLIAASTTYGLGGWLRYGGAGGGGEGVWRFVQPFEGGTAFVTTQAISWSTFAATVVLLVALLQQLAAGVAACFRCWAIGAGALMLLAQAMLAVSLLLFRGPKSAAAKLIRAASGALSSTLQPRQGWVGANMPVLLMYLPVHVFFSLWALSFAFLPTRAALTGWAAFLVPYYALSSAGRPAHTGRRRWPWLLSWFEANIEGSLAHWFGHVRVVHDAPAHAGAQPPGAAEEGARPAAGGAGAAGKKVMYGFAPHGLYPTGAGFLPMMPSFRTGLPPGRPPPVSLAASALFAPPFIRDVISWAGFRQVSRPTFLAALEEAGAIMFCPGGQAELVHTGRAFRAGARELVLHTRHKGFCRRGAPRRGAACRAHARHHAAPASRAALRSAAAPPRCRRRIAIEHQAALVPVLALGESLQLRNAVDLPALAQFTYKRFGFPVPFILTGRWGVTPFPRRTPLVYVVGAPLTPPPLAPGVPAAQADVDALHSAYYSSLVELFAKYKHLHPELCDARVVLVDD
ncbi:RCH2 [Scenedesmus sp. PABB004]|nr:RCH2 [Scenedesmus sp. PABB004]